MGVYFSHRGVNRPVTHSSLEPPVGSSGRVNDEGGGESEPKPWPLGSGTSSSPSPPSATVSKGRLTSRHLHCSVCLGLRMGGCLGPALGGGSCDLHSFTICSGFSGSQVAGWDLHGAGASPWLCFQSWGSHSPPAKPSLSLQPQSWECAGCRLRLALSHAWGLRGL